MKTRPVHHSLMTQTETNMQEHVYQFITKPVRDVSELTQHLIETWSATSKASLIKRLISSKIVLMHVSKPKAFAILFLRNCHDLCFISQGSVRTAVIRGGQFCCFTIG